MNIGCNGAEEMIVFVSVPGYQNTPPASTSLESIYAEDVCRRQAIFFAGFHLTAQWPR
jgi:hypothetical protein